MDLAPLLGAMIVYPATELVSGVLKFVDIAVSALLVATALFFPKGVADSLDAVTVWRRFRSCVHRKLWPQAFRIGAGQCIEVACLQPGGACSRPLPAVEGRFADLRSQSAFPRYLGVSMT